MKHASTIIPDEQGRTELNPLRFDALRNLCIAARWAAEVRQMTPAPSPEVHPTLEELEKAEYVKAYRQAGTIRGAAKLLCMPETTVQNKLQRWRIRPQRIAKNIIRLVACLMFLLVPVVGSAQVKGATKLLTLAAPAQPAAPAALTVNPVAPVSAAPAPQRLSNLVPVTLAWSRSPDASVIGYRAVWGTNSAATTNTTIVLRVPAGVTNTFYVVAVDAAGVESVPSNIVPFRAINLPQATLTTAVWSYSTAGYFGATNRIQTSTNLTDWTTRLTFIGRGMVTNLWRTNSTQEFFRTTTIN